MNNKNIFDNPINDHKTKINIINYLYNTLNLSNYRYNILNNISKLLFLQQNEHYVSPNYKGFNYFLIFTIINNNKLCIIIDRKKLSYHKNQLDIKNLQLYNLKIECDDELYKGSILDCKLINNKSENIFIIQDYFYLAGENYLNLDLVNKLNYINNYINNVKSNYLIKINKLFNYKELNNLINNLQSLPYKNTGLVFYPKKSGITIFFIETKNEKININSSNELIEEKSYNIINNYVNFLKSREYSYESNGKNKNFFLSKTNIPDVYNLHEIDTNDKSELGNSSNFKIGIACIPNLKISQMCEELINDYPVKFNCIYCNKFNKWIPLNKID
jgi:hypothetical protein